ncbi:MULTISPECIES: DUF6188 family protein [unclassified Streptomyces]|uniref:DUF6188 family protein n=1 Tax=unclassified Streptomyces TaxID=2593676 RepID=UPI0033AA1F06
MTKESTTDRWVLDLRGLPVRQVTASSDPAGNDPPRFALVLGAVTEVAVEGAVRMTNGPATAPGAVGLPVTAECGALVDATVLSATGSHTGSLRLVFSTGHQVAVRGDDPGIRIRVRRPGAFEWVSGDGAGVLTPLDQGL